MENEEIKENLSWSDLPATAWWHTICSHREQEFQKKKVYAAENTARDFLLYNRRFLTIKDIQDFIDRLIKEDWFLKHWPLIPVVLEIKIKEPVKDEDTTCATGSFSTGIITLPRWAYIEVVVLHELAHVVTAPCTGSAHGRYWAKAFLELVAFAMGQDDMKMLRKCFEYQGVKYYPKYYPKDYLQKQLDMGSSHIY